MMVTTAVKTEVTPELMKDVIGRLFEAYASHEPDRILALFTKDLVWEETGLAKPLRSKAAVKEHLGSLFRAMPDLRYYDVDFFISLDGAKGASHWRVMGTMTGAFDPPGYAPTNEKVEFEGACFYTFRDGLIARHDVVYDMAAVGRQIGALPKEGSVADKLGVQLQRLAMKSPLRRVK